MGIGWGGAWIDHAAIAAEMAPAVATTYSAHLRVYRPGVTSGRYDPETDSGGQAVPTLLHDTGPRGGSVTPRGARAVAFGGQANAVQEVELQFGRGVVTRPGDLIRVVDGGNEPGLTGQVFAVTEGTNTSAAWGNVVHARVALGTLLSSESEIPLGLVGIAMVDLSLVSA